MALFFLGAVLLAAAGMAVQIAAWVWAGRLTRTEGLGVREAFRIVLLWAVISLLCAGIVSALDLPRFRPFIGLLELAFLVSAASIILRAPVKKVCAMAVIVLSVSLLFALVVAVPVRVFVVQAFKVPTDSMAPIIMRGDRVLVYKMVYRVEDPKRWDVAVIREPTTKKFFIKRVVGLPGETVEIRNGDLLINGRNPSRPASLQEIRWLNAGDFGKEGTPVSVPQDSYYLLSDNSTRGRDSRYFGLVPKSRFIGKVRYIYWPLNRLLELEKQEA